MSDYKAILSYNFTKFKIFQFIYYYYTIILELHVIRAFAQGVRET